MKKSSANMWHAALLLLAFSIISFAATPFLFTTIGQAAPTLSLISAACAAGMVHKLTLYLKCSIEDILNREPLIANKSGTYRKIKYKWVPTENGTVTLNIKDGQTKKIIDESKCDQARFYQTFDNMTELIIDYYITQKEVDANL